MAKKAKRGGKRPGSGRKTMFAGPRVPLAVKVTQACMGLIEETRAELEPKHGSAATVGSAVEYLIRKARPRKRNARA